MAGSGDDAGMLAARRTRLIQSQSQLIAPPLVPEVQLFLARHSRLIWQAVEEAADDPRSAQPFWAFAWPGGQAKARYILDNPALVAGKRILDVGSGSGLAAIAAIKAGAHSVIANDIDPLACAAIRLNAAANAVAVAVTDEDILSGTPAGIDLVLLADVVYDPELETRVAGFIADAITRKLPLLFGDRGTTRLPSRPLDKLVEYKVTVFPELEEGFFERGIVWRLI
jgi:predicted nicotinamide N-methyase